MNGLHILLYGAAAMCAVLTYLRVVAVAIDQADAAAQAREQQSRREKKVSAAS